MSCLIDYGSPYLATLNLNDSYANTVTTLIKAASSWVEHFCNRHFAQAEYDEVFMVEQDSSIVLRHPPIAYVSRMMTASGNWLVLKNTNRQANYSTTATALLLNSFASGVQTSSTLNYATYATLGALATAINLLSGWTATVVNGFTEEPAADLVTGQYGQCGLGSQSALVQWMSDARQMSVNLETGIIEGYGGIAWNEPYPVVWNTAGAAGFFGFYGYCRYQQVRVVYVAGYTPDQIPEPIKQVVGNLVVSAFQNPEGRARMLTLGGEFTYELADYDKLAISDKKVLAFYRDRWV